MSLECMFLQEWHIGRYYMTQIYKDIISVVELTSIDHLDDLEPMQYHFKVLYEIYHSNGEAKFLGRADNEIGEIILSMEDSVWRILDIKNKKLLLQQASVLWEYLDRWMSFVLCKSRFNSLFPKQQ